MDKYLGKALYYFVSIFIQFYIVTLGFVLIIDIVDHLMFGVVNVVDFDFLVLVVENIEFKLVV